MELSQIIQQSYAILDNLPFMNGQVSITSLIVAALIFTLALFFAVREACSWFFKVDGLKRDVRKLHKLTVDLEKEIKALQQMIASGAVAPQPVVRAVGSEGEGPIAIRESNDQNRNGSGFTFNH